MKHTALRYLSALTLAAAATSGFAQTAPAGTVEAKDVKTWIITVDGKDYEARPLTPTFSGDTGLFHLPSAYTLAKGKSAFSIYRMNLDRNPKDLDATTIGLSFAYGVSSKLEIFGTFGAQRNDVDILTQPGYVNDFPRAGRQTTSPGWQTGASDAIIGAKFKLLDDYGSDGVGLAIRPTIKLPTASFDNGLGTGKVSFGADLILSKSLNNQAEIHGMVGYQMNSDPDGFDLGNAFRWGAGLTVPVYKKFQLQAEVLGTNYSDGDFEQINPIDFVIGPVFYFAKGVFVRPAYSYNMKFEGLSTASYKSNSGMNISIGYSGAAQGREIYVPPPPPPPAPPAPPKVENRPPTVSLDADKTNAITCDTVRFRANAADPDGDTLTYAWTTSAGRTVGEGANVTLEPGCLPVGTDVTVTVTVNDGHNHTATATRHVMIEAKPKPQTVTRSMGPFPTVKVGGGTRLNNMDKSVLDDMATRLRQDPASRLLIVGHAEKGEPRPDVLSRKRAEAVKAYMIKERGIDGSRIITRGAGAGGGRSADLTFVPDGADMPM
ncbi:MAG TPA: OmpA family protein [Vicinamibacteria bacterium]|nr:OmpA family protein [Vicinamibacteria bacterium]HRB11678.1 OmpA family protein [Vicinamibacteria bacterium]